MSWAWAIVAIVVILAWAYSPLGQFRPPKTPAYGDRNSGPSCAVDGRACSQYTKCCSGLCRNGTCASSAQTRRGNCFSADSTVVTADGSTRRLGELRVGDRLMTVDANGQRVVDAVRAITHQDRAPALFLALRAESGNVLEVTPDHFVYVIRGGRVQLVKAQAAAAGDFLVRDSGKRERIVSVDAVERCGSVNFYMTQTPMLCVNGLWASPLCDSAGVLTNEVSMTTAEFLGKAVCKWRHLISCV